MGTSRDTAAPQPAAKEADHSRAAASGSMLLAVQSAARRVGNSNLPQLLQPPPSPEERRAQEQIAARTRTAGALTGAMSAFGDARKDAVLRDIYLDLRALDGNIDDLLAASRRIERAGVAVAVPARPSSGNDEYGHRLDSLREALRDGIRASIEMRLKPYGLTVATFEQQIERFKKAFNAATADQAASLLDQAEGLCQWYLSDVRELQNAASRMTELLRPERKSILAEIDRAWDLRDKTAYLHRDDPKANDAMRMEAKRIEAAAHARVMSTLAAYPFVRWPGFPLEALTESTKPERAAALVRSYLEDHVDQLRDARGQINSERIYQLDLLLKSARERFGIPDGSLSALLIDEQKRHVGTSLLQKIETALAFALMVTSFVVPGAVVVTAPLSAALGAHAAAAAILQYREDRTAYQAGLMSENPSPLWALAALIGAGLEISAALKVLRLQSVAEALARFGKSRKVAQLSSDLERAGLDSTTRKVITSEADELARGTQSGATAATQPSTAPPSTAASSVPTSTTPSPGAPATPTKPPTPSVPSSGPSFTAAPPTTRPPRQIPVQQGTQSPGHAPSGGAPQRPPSGNTTRGQTPVGEQQQLTGPRKPPGGTPPTEPAPEVDPASLGAEPDPDLASHLGADPLDPGSIAAGPELGPTSPPPKPPASTPSGTQPSRGMPDLMKKVREGKATVKAGGQFDKRLPPGRQKALDKQMTPEAREEERRLAKQRAVRDRQQDELEAKRQAQRQRDEQNLPPEERARRAQRRAEAEKKRAEREARQLENDRQRALRREAKRKERAQRRAEEAAKKGKIPDAADNFEEAEETADLDPDDD